jgi:hypothetical protein
MNEQTAAHMFSLRRSRPSRPSLSRFLSRAIVAVFAVLGLVRYNLQGGGENMPNAPEVFENRSMVEK